MAKKVSENDILSINDDWGLDTSNNLPYSGAAVQKFIKNTFNTKMGYFYYDTTSNRYLVFASELSKDQYLENPQLTNLILGSFDAPFNYEAIITLASPQYVAIPVNTTGNIIEFTFDIKNKQGVSVGEDVTCTYTIIRGATKKTITQKYRSGSLIQFNVDEYIGEGTNKITIGIVGQNTLAATTIGVTYQVVNLTITDEMNISKVYDLSKGPQVVEIPFSTSGYGTKILEWYLDGNLLAFDKNIDEITDVTLSRVKYITINNLSRGTHNIEYRVYTMIDGEKFYSHTLHRDILVENSELNDVQPIIGVAYSKANLDDVGIQLTQHVPYTVRFATYNPVAPVSTDVSIYIGEQLQTVIAVPNGIEAVYSLVSSETGVKQVKFSAAGTDYIVDTNTNGSPIKIEEISSDIELGFSAIGKSNNSSDRDSWFGNNITAMLNGFGYTQTSGWVDNRLYMNAGSSIVFENYKPLLNDVTSTGKTLEFEFNSSNVSNDNAVICDLRDTTGAGILITASEASVFSRGGVSLSTKYKSEENVRISFVINRSSGVTNKGLVFIYVDGIVSAGVNFATTDDFISDAVLTFVGTDDAEVALKQVRIYNTALTSDQILNNYILYRDTNDEMLRIYDRNNIYEEGTVNFSIDKLQGQLPVMLITGDIPALESTTNKDTQITVDIDYYNLQNPSFSFKMKNAALRPQGTSSMLYPKKNYRPYTKKLEDTVLYDSEGNVVENKLYAFKENSQPVDCWCLKADYAESSGTHNTGIARLWNEILYNTSINGEFVLRTEAQKAALENGYPYDVRTTVDGFPILLFYRMTEKDEPVFIGKYNFNNDKSTESVFGFKDIPGFDNSRMQCWEILNNGDALALFTDVHDFDTRWSDAFESRYPDTKTPNTDDLKAFSIWLNSMNGNHTAFATEKWQHMDVYKMAAYYIYIMRFGAVDQTVKNAMLTSEDGEKFYFINYDNDTINGLRNNGVLVFDPTIDRQSLDPETGGLAYAYAGHDSVLWNMLEADDEFMQIVKDVDNALYTNGLNYDNVVRMFNEQQADMWNERVYNQDAQYKYINPYVDSNLNNLEMLQGKRQSHRKWWLSKRFSLYDSKFVSGDFKGKALEFKVINNTAPGWTFSIEAGTDMEYGYGVYNPKETGVALQKGQSHSFTIDQTLNIGDPVRIYSAVNLQSVDLSNILPRLSNVELNNVWNESLGSKLKKLILGNGTDENTVISAISSISKAKILEYLDIRGCKGMTTLDLSSNHYMKTLLATGSSLTSVEFAKGSAITTLQLPSTMQVLQFDQLPNLTHTGIVLEGGFANIQQIDIKSCYNLSSSIDFINSWLSEKTINDSRCSLYIDNINWNNVDYNDIIRIAQLKENGGNVTLKGIIRLNDITFDAVDYFKQIFGDNVFTKDSELQITAPDCVFITGPDIVTEGYQYQYSYDVLSDNIGTVEFIAVSGSGFTISKTGLLKGSVSGSDRSVVIRAIHRPTSGTTTLREKTILIEKKRYVSTATITGPDSMVETTSFDLIKKSSNSEHINTPHTVDWTITGDAVTAGYVEIANPNQLDYCELTMLNPGPPLPAVLQAVITNDNGKTITVTKDILIGFEVAVSKMLNPEVMQVCYDQGWALKEDYMTVEEAAAIEDIGTAFYGKPIKTFDEFSYFTNVAEIPNNAFYNSGLKSFYVPEHITHIGNKAFYQCTSLETITLNGLIDDVIMGAGSSSYAMSSLTNIHFGKTAKINIDVNTNWLNYSVGTDSSYATLSYLNSITVDEENPYHTSIDGVLYDKSAETLICYPRYKCLINGNVTGLPSTLKDIGPRAFQGCRPYLKTIDFSNVSLRDIGAYAFYRCSMFSFDELTVSGTVYDYAFEQSSVGNASANKITIGGDVRRSAFSSFRVKEIYIGGEIYQYCLSKSGVEKITFGGLAEGESSTYVLQDCKPTYVRCLRGVLSIGTNKMTSANTVILEEGVTKAYVGDTMYANNVLETIHLPSTLQDFSIANCSALTTVTFANTLPSISRQAFSSCTALEKISINARYIGEYAFSGCTALSDVTIQDTVETIDAGAFANTAITEIIIPASVKNIIGGYSVGAFSSCYNLKTVTILGKLDSLGKNTFMSCSALESVYLEGVGSLSGSYIFAGCKKLKSITIKQSAAPTIGEYTMGDSSYGYAGTDVPAGEKFLYVPEGATGYTSSYWNSRVLSSSYCGFQLQEIEYSKTTTIYIDQSISDPSTMITRTVDEGAIEAIRKNSHRYVGTYDESTQTMSLKQLSDTDGTKYADGTNAELTTLGKDVWMKLPKFYYKAENIPDSFKPNYLWTITFKYGSQFEEGELDGFKEWDGKDLIGVYKAYSDDQGLYSVSGVTPTGSKTPTEFINLAQARGNGFSLVKLKHHSIMGFLFYALYTNTNCQAIVGSGTSTSRKTTGATNALSMEDTSASTNGNSQSINFWGLENWWGDAYETICNVVAAESTFEITEDDGSIRTITKHPRGGYINRILIGSNLDLICADNLSGGSSTTYFCDHAGVMATGDMLRRSYNSNKEDGGVACMSSTTSTWSSENSCTRLCYRGDYVII